MAKEIDFLGGGHLNHEFFWDSLMPTSEGGGVEPEADSDLGKLLLKSFGSFELFKKEFNSRAGAIKSSGWGWLIYDVNSDSLNVQTAFDHERLFVGTPLLTVDVWEHAYYVDNLNSRGGFLEKIWQVVNWEMIA